MSNELKFYYKGQRRMGAYKDSFPDGCQFFQQWEDVPEGWHTETQLKKMKKWRDNLIPVAGKRCQNGYYPLYDYHIVGSERTIFIEKFDSGVYDIELYIDGAELGTWSANSDTEKDIRCMAIQDEYGECEIRFVV